MPSYASSLFVTAAAYASTVPVTVSLLFGDICNARASAGCLRIAIGD